MKHGHRTFTAAYKTQIVLDWIGLAILRLTPKYVVEKCFRLKRSSNGKSSF